MGGGGGPGYASAIAIEFDGQREYVQFTGHSLIGVAASDGKFLWKYDKSANMMGINCSTPIYQDGEVFSASAYGAGGGLVKLSKDGDSMKAEEVYHTDKMQNHHGGMILLDGSLYGANGGNGGGNLVCLDFKTGKVLWDERDDKEHRVPKGSILLADGRLYYRTEDKGTLLLIEPSAKKYIECGRFEQPNRSHAKAWTHPVIANGKLYIRDQDALFCYDVKAK
jgi:outer membrane protein assembly factor BamB